jgi:hypothetical protein
MAPPFSTSALDGVEWSVYDPASLPQGKLSPICIEWEAGLPPQLVWSVWKREESFHTGIETYVPIFIIFI